MVVLKIEVLKKIREQKKKKKKATLYLNCVFTERSQPTSRRYIEQMGWQRHTDSWFCLAYRCLTWLLVD